LEAKNQVYERLRSEGIELNLQTTPMGAYTPFVQTGNLLFVSGHVAKLGGVPWVGQLGRDMETAAGVGAARSVATDMLGTLQVATGDLNRIVRIVKVLCLVNSTPIFTEHHIVANGFSELIESIFGTSGKHARSTFGVAQLPTGACVEVELIAELRDGHV
jgi:enamine deaminase RidA (YjgF/YER057c/UK114 family)